MKHHHCPFTEALELTELAQRIVSEGAPSVLRCNLSDHERRSWESVASWYLAAQSDGLEDEDGFAEMVDEFYNPASDQGWALDVDFLRDEQAAYRSFGA